jgi:glycosyltransferase involved in cell wall biosynthesis
VWLRLPASNALLALVAARRQGVRTFGWVAGSAAQVAAAQPRPWPLRSIARAIGQAYDAVSRLAGGSGPLLDLDADLFASVVTEQEIEETRAARLRRRPHGPRRIVWAGRMAGEKGLAELITAVVRLLAGGLDAKLVLIGGGPARATVERRLAALPADRVEDYGYVGDRSFYMDLLRGGDVLVHPSGAEGLPKVIVEAMAAGLPVIATDAGAVRELLDDGRLGVCLPGRDSVALAAAVEDVLGHPRRTRLMSGHALEWAAQHTAEAQARRLVTWLSENFPQLGLAARERTRAG